MGFCIYLDSSFFESLSIVFCLKNTFYVVFLWYFPVFALKPKHWCRERGFANMDRVYAMGSCRGNTLESKKLGKKQIVFQFAYFWGYKKLVKPKKNQPD